MPLQDGNGDTDTAIVRRLELPSVTLITHLPSPTPCPRLAQKSIRTRMISGPSKAWLRRL